MPEHASTSPSCQHKQIIQEQIAHYVISVQYLYNICMCTLGSESMLLAHILPLCTLYVQENSLSDHQGTSIGHHCSQDYDVGLCEHMY